MSMTVMQLEQAIERAEREGRQADVDKLRFLLGEVTGDGAVNQAPGHVYTVLEGDDVFGISEMLLGSIEYVPDLLKANPDTNFATGDEIVVPDVGGDEATAAASDAAALVELFETKGPPNDSWTAEDYALLKAVQAQVVGSGDDPADVPPNNRETTSGQSGQIAGDEDEHDKEETKERVPVGTANIDLPAEDAEVIAQFMAQMIANGVVPDESAWGPDGREESAERREREQDSWPDDPGNSDEEEAAEWVEKWYSLARQDAKLNEQSQTKIQRQYEAYLAQITAGEMSAEDARELVNPHVEADTPQYDLTDWLVSEMVLTATSPEIVAVEKYMNGQGILIREEDSQGLENLQMGLGIMFGTFSNSGPKNIKVEIKSNIGDGVVLCGEESCQWVDYSTPGNILFGYSAAAGSVPRPIYLAAGGAAQMWDEGWRDPNANYQERWLFDGSWGDDPFDKAAVDFGVHLFETYGTNLSVEDFQRELTKDVLESLQPPPEGFNEPFPASSQENNYEPGQFDLEQE